MKTSSFFKKASIAVILLVTTSFLINANDDTKTLPLTNTWVSKANGSTHFIENKGQITQINGEPAPNVAHILQRGNTNIYLLREGGIAYQFNRIHYPEDYIELMLGDRKDNLETLNHLAEMKDDIRLETYRMNMHLEGGNPNAKIITEGKSEDYLNYYTHNTLKVHHYEKVIYKEIYPGIDWIIYTTKDGGIKYDFEVKPGADPLQIKLKFTHQEELYLDENGNLIHGNRLGYFTEKAPVSFQQERSIPTHFIIENNTLSFALENYDSTLSLIIDPNRIWGTYYGGSGWDLGFSYATDDSSNVYLIGSTRSTSSIAADGHQNTYGGGPRDAFLVKFNSLGIRQWATYYGGSGVTNDSGYFCSTDNMGNIYIAGSTGSEDNIASNGHQNTLTGLQDAFLVKFNSSGVRLWGTYYGGGGYTTGYSCTTDNDNNVYLSGGTSSSFNIASNGHQNTTGGGYDAFLAKFDESGTRQWATYYGGSNNDIGRSCVSDNNDNIYLTGQTSSENNIASDGHQNSYEGETDAFLVKFNSSGARLWGTYYGGSEFERSRFCTIDNSGNVYIAGETESLDNIASDGHQDTYGGLQDAFLVKFNDLGERQWATYYGGSEVDYGYACTTDENENIYLIGSTESTDNIALNGHQNIHGGQMDGYLVKFNNSGIRQWATYYGGSGIDWGMGCISDNTGNIYITGETESTSAIAYDGHQNTLGGSFDAFAVKFKGDSAGTYIENSLIEQLKVFPNPVQSTLFVILPKNLEQVTLRLFNLAGQLISEKQATGYQHELDIHALSEGVYVLHVDNGITKSIVKIVKQ